MVCIFGTSTSCPPIVPGLRQCVSYFMGSARASPFAIVSLPLQAFNIQDSST